VADEIDVEERDSHFQGVGHGGAVDLHEDALLEVELGAEVKEAFQATGEAAALGQAGDIFKWIGAVELVAGVGRKKIPALRVATGPHPKEEANFRRKAEALDELGQKERKTFVVMGNGEALDDVIDGIAYGDGKEGKAFQQEMGLEAGVAGKEFVPAVPAQDGFDLRGGESGKKPSGDEGGIA